MRTPTAEATLYDSATAKKPLTETDKTVLPVSTLGMRSRKKALRELRCIPARIARENAEAAAAEKARAEAAEEARIADEDQAKADAKAAKAEEKAKAKAAKAEKKAQGK